MGLCLKSNPAFGNMLVIKSINKLKRTIIKAKGASGVIGFIPTMGALHSGHLALTAKAREECDFVVVSVFVNPAQFGPYEDYKKYPRNFSRDEKLLKAEGVDIVFYPGVKDIYPEGFSTYVLELNLSRFLCGAKRLNHFRGVCTILAKLFNLIGPDKAYFGQKDFQQAQIVKKMVDDLNFPIKVKVLPTVRERDGLAMSSRNRYLNKEQRKEALCLRNSLLAARALVKDGETKSSTVIKKIRSIINSQKTSRIDYVEVCDPESLRSLKQIKGRAIILLAVYIGRTRLIDNILIQGR